MDDINMRRACANIDYTLHRLSNHMIDVLTHQQEPTDDSMSELCDIHQAMVMSNKQIEKFLSEHGIIEY